MSATPEETAADITREMEAAGAAAIEDWSGILDPYALARKVYAAMAAVETDERSPAT